MRKDDTPARAFLDMNRYFICCEILRYEVEYLLQEPEIEALRQLIEKTGVNFLHLKNLCIDPSLYLEKMPGPRGPGIGMRRMAEIVRAEFPSLELGYFNQPVHRAPD